MGRVCYQWGFSILYYLGYLAVPGVVCVDPEDGHQQVVQEDGGVLILLKVLLPHFVEDQMHGLNSCLIEPAQ